MVLPLRGAKRKAVHVDVEVATRKKTRCSRSPETPSSRSSENTEDDNDEDRRASEEEPSSSSASTPLSPASLIQPDQRPSRLKNLPCPYPDCPKAFVRRSRLSEHLRSHTNTRPFVCTHAPCTKDFLRESHLKHHIKSAHSNKRDYACTHAGCDKSYATGTRLRRHLTAHEKRESYTCKAPGCGQAFRKHATLQAHVSSEHEGKAPYPCLEVGEDGVPCGAGFDTPYKWNTHMGRIHGQDRYFCTLCSTVNDQQSEDATQSMQPSPVNGGLGFPTYAALQVHNKMTHPRKCEECGYKTSYPNELTHHIEIQHGGQHITERATHHCREPGCGRSFTRNGNLLIHLKTAHAKGKAYVCGSIDISNLNHIDIANWSGSDACGHGFTSKQSLEDHIRFVHMGVERPRKEQKKKKRNKDKPQRSGKSKASALSRLAGTAYDEDTSRTIACFRLDCPQRFSREYDLEMHMQSAHDLADFEIQLLRAARDGIGPASYGYSLASERTAEDLEAERALDEMFGSTRLKGVEEALEEAAERGGQFWVGGRANDDRNMNGDDWGREERELRNLIDEDGNEVDEALEEAAHRGGQFWVGGSAYADDPISGNDDWEMEEAELRQLIDEDEGGAGEMMIDPMLR